MSLMDKKDQVYGSGKLEKACVVVDIVSTQNVVMSKRINVQFNPSEYSIRRGVKTSQKKAMGADASPVDGQAVRGEQSVLSVTLYFDSYTELKSKQGAVNLTVSTLAGALKGAYNEAKPNDLPSFDMNENLSPDPDYKVNKLCNSFLSLVKYAAENHAPPQVAFIWGEHLHFEGKVVSYTVQYTVFDRDGTPLRAKLSMDIEGEEKSLVLEMSEFPFESPDRTKQRMLRYGDQLWMMAQSEYGDPGCWKVIAQSNGILNPRTLNTSAMLKLPSIR